MKQVDPSALDQKMRDEPSKVHAFVLLDDEGQPVEAFENHAEVVETVLAGLEKASDILGGFHAAMRAELTGGC